MKTQLTLLVLIFITTFSCQSIEKNNASNTNAVVMTSNDSLPPQNARTEYYESGELRIEAEIHDNQYHGKFHEYFSNGTISNTGTFVKGQKNGIWKTYSPLGDLLKVDLYNLDSLLFGLDPSDFEFENVIIDDNHMSLLLPSQWETNLNPSQNVLFQSAKKCEESAEFCPSITATLEKFKSKLSPQEYINQSVEKMIQRFPNFRIIAQGSIIINDIPSFQITYIFQSDDITLGGVTTWLFNEDKVYIITGIAANQTNSEFLKYKDYFQEISASIKRN